MLNVSKHQTMNECSFHDAAMVDTDAQEQHRIPTAAEMRQSIFNRKFEACEVPKDLQCPITIELMMDPVVAADGFAYEREAIKNWLQSKVHSPLTNLPLPTKQVYTSHTLRSLIQDWVSKNPDWLLENPDWSAEKVDVCV